MAANAVDKVLRLAKEKGVKQSFLADLIGGYSSKLTEWKNGKSTPTEEEIRTLADFFGVSLSYFLGEVEDGMITSDEAVAMAEIVGDHAKMNQYSAKNIRGSALAQGSNSGTVTVRNDEQVRALSDEENELLRVYASLDVKRRIRLLDFAFKLESEASE
jgi:transcriptional regulator with XRE-family HTH domain